MEDVKRMNLKILYVEDDPDTLETLSRFLKRRFSRVETASDGRRGYEKFCALVPDIILTDLLMEDVDGMEFVNRVRRTGFAGPIIVISALRDAESIVKTVDLGITKYILKPVDLQSLDRCLASLAKNILSDRSEVFGFPCDIKKQKEKAMGHAMSGLLKKSTGKGPRDVKVFIGPDRVEITCIGVLTPLEETLVKTKANVSYVEHCRVLLYQEIKQALEGELSAIAETQLYVENVISDCRAGTDYIQAGKSHTKIRETR